MKKGQLSKMIIAARQLDVDTLNKMVREVEDPDLLPFICNSQIVGADGHNLAWKVLVAYLREQNSDKILTKLIKEEV